MRNAWRGGIAVAAAVLLAACATWIGRTESPAAPERFSNAYVDEADTGARVPPTYFLRRARVQITRDLDRTEVPPTVPLDLSQMAGRTFAVTWLGHSALLVRAGSAWVLLDPVLSNTAGPVAGFGPARLTRLPLAPEHLPRIDLVLISHDHYDHLDLWTMRRLATQSGGPPRVFAGRGLAAWFREHVQNTAEEFDWWQSADVGDLRLTFVPAQHGSGRSLRSRNTTLWGGWVIEHGGRRFYFAGDTAYVRQLFLDIRARVGPIDLAALPIGAYQPRALMRHEHTDPDDAVLAHLNLGAARSFGVHWGTFQLGDEEPFQPARDLAEVVRRRGVDTFGLLPIGAVLDVHSNAAGATAAWTTPAALAASTARSAKNAAVAAGGLCREPPAC